MAPIDSPRRPLTIAIGTTIVLAALAVPLAWQVARVRYERDVTQLVLSKTYAALEEAARADSAAGDSLRAFRGEAPDTPGDKPYLVVSIAENRLWYKQGDSVLFTTRVATGTGGELKKIGSKSTWKFDTPRGRLVVQKKETEPLWVPPDWHFVELAKKKKLSLTFLRPGKTIPLPDGGVIAVSGHDVVRRTPDGTEIPFDAREGREIIVGKRLVVPPMETNQRRFAGVLGAFRLYLGDGYGIHGTDVPSSIGRSASHGCIRVRNEDIETLYQLVPVGTPVFVY